MAAVAEKNNASQYARIAIHIAYTENVIKTKYKYNPTEVCTITLNQIIQSALPILRKCKSLEFNQISNSLEGRCAQIEIASRDIGEVQQGNFGSRPPVILGDTQGQVRSSSQFLYNNKTYKFQADVGENGGIKITVSNNLLPNNNDKDPTGETEIEVRYAVINVARLNPKDNEPCYDLETGKLVPPKQQDDSKS